MNRTILMIAGVFGASSLLLVDSAVKGTALLLVAGVLAMMLRRDSAATRHLVWLLEIVALLVVPVLSAMLPGWRVLPEWAGVSAKLAVVDTPWVARPPEVELEMLRSAEVAAVERPSATVNAPAVDVPEVRGTVVKPLGVVAPTAVGWKWVQAMPLVWAVGFCVLLLRLMAARWLLWKCEARGMVVEQMNPGRRTVVERPGSAPAWMEVDPIVTAFDAARSQLGIVRPVTLLIHPERTIPIVWGIVRCRLLLPVAARDWSGEQLRSVLLHELAHVKRRDMLAQLLAQVACALHWFN